ncbi:MAG: hypothetical protein WCT10_00380 [Patescibacteria group bacterium]|jgi:hypothetical protein
MFRQIILMSVIAACSMSCLTMQDVAKNQAATDAILQGEHQLRKIAERTETSSRATGGFFLFVGSYGSSSQQQVIVRFAWQMPDGIYAISSLPLERIRVKLDNAAAVPTIRFNWEPCGYEGPTIQTLMDDHVQYAVVTVRESDWPIDINLPLEKPE